jgi:hypothetical protein
MRTPRLPADPRRPATPDIDLLEWAIARAGGIPGLAAQLGVRPNTPHTWRTRLRGGGTLSADKRRRLEAFVEGAERTAVDPAVVRVQVLEELRRYVDAQLARARAAVGVATLRRRARS